MGYVLVKDANGFFSQVSEEEYNKSKKEVVHLPKPELKLNKIEEKPAVQPLPKPEIKKPMVKK